MTLSPTASGSGSSGAGSLTLLSTTNLAAPGTFDLSALSSSYNDLVLVMIARGTNAAAGETVQLRFNNDSGANYYREALQVLGSAAVSGVETLGSTVLGSGHIPGSTGLANSFGAVEITVYGYASTSWLKVVQWHAYSTDSTATTNVVMHRGGGSWNSTAAISRVTLFGGNTANLATGSQLRIYGRL